MTTQTGGVRGAMAEAREGGNGRIVARLTTTGRAVAWERLRRPMARVVTDVPRAAEAITPEWLTAVLCRELPGAAVVSCSVVGGSRGTSTRAVLRLVYNDAGAAAGLPTDLFAKTTTSLTQRLVLGLAKVIDGEIEFFNRVRPRLAIETPQGYFAALEPRSWRSISLIEDVAATKGAAFLHATSPITRQNVEGLLGGLATMHGTMWRDGEVERPDSWMKTPLDHLRNISAFISMRKRSGVGAQRAAAVMPAPLLGRLDDLWAGFERSMRYATGAPMTFLHGDANVGDTYVTGRGEMGWTDWQVCLRGCWAYDVAYIHGHPQCGSRVGRSRQRAGDHCRRVRPVRRGGRDVLPGRALVRTGSGGRPDLVPPAGRPRLRRGGQPGRGAGGLTWR